MGVTFLQHRIVTGCGAHKYSIHSGASKYTKRCSDKRSWKNDLTIILYGIICIFYVYAISLLLAGAIITAGDVSVTRLHSSYNIGLVSLNDICYGVLNSAMLTLLSHLYVRRRNYLLTWAKKYYCIFGFFLKRKSKRNNKLKKHHKSNTTTMQILSNCISIWATILNLVLIVICNPGILNPGPLNSINVVYQNVRGLVPFSCLGKPIMPLDTDKIVDLQCNIFNDGPDVVILNETWLSKEHLDNEIFPNETYNIFRQDRSKKTHPPDPNNSKKFRIKGGGVLIAVKANLSVQTERINISSKAEMLSISIKSKNETICITTCYRVGTLGEENFKEIEKHLRNLAARKKFSAHYVIGDFNLCNISWVDEHSSVELERRFIDLFNDLGLVQLIEQPTHEKGHILDILLTNTVGSVSDLSVLGKNNICSSDHFGIKFSIKTKVKTKITKRKILNYKKANWESLNNDLKSVRWDSHLQHCDAETGWSRFKNILNHFLNLHIPTITIKNKKQPPWFDSDVHHLCQKKERLRAKFKTTNLAEDYDKFSECRKKFKKLVREKMISNFDDQDDPTLISKKLWSHLKSTSKSSRIPSTVNYKGRFRNNAKDQTEIFNEFFQDQFSEASCYDIDVDFSNDSINNIDFSTNRIRKILRNINVNKAVGPDGIHGKVLKNCRESLAYPLSLLFKMSYNIGQIPSEWKLANVVPLHKKGSKASVENYRPISLTSLVMKVFEKIVRDELLAKCQHKLNNFQHGFLPEKSCTTQMLLFSDNLSISLNSNIRADVIYFDFEKAFDSVNHDIILTKLKNRFQIDGTLLKFIMNYLQHRKQCVVIDGAKSIPRDVTSGVPQGSILGPLFFVLFIDDISEVISDGTNIALYADDTKIWRKIECWNDHNILQNDIDALYSWSVAHKMKFHPQKCKVLSVARKCRSDSIWRNFPFQFFFYKLNGTDLDYVDNEKDLGVIVNTNLTWGDNTTALCLKASSRLGLVKRTVHFIKDRKQRRAFYLSLVRSLFEHCSVVWGPSSEEMLQKIEAIQRRAVKWIMSEHNHHYNDYEYLCRLKELDLLPMKYKFIYTDLVQFFDIYYDRSVVKLPNYLTPIDDNDRGRLRSNVRPPISYSQYTTHNMSDVGSIRNTRFGKLSLKCTIEAKTPAFKNSFFFRTHILWNNIPVEIRESTVKGEFQSKLKHHLWDVALDPG